MEAKPTIVGIGKVVFTFTSLPLPGPSRPDCPQHRPLRVHYTPTLGAPRDPLYYQSPPRGSAQPSGRAARGVIALSGRSKLLPLVGDALVNTLDVAQYGSPSELLHVVHVV